ncbi:MAG: glycosyltransferase family 4 protein [Bacteroidales bacterium]|nr:glycosyltransferase family 4 protein [Bacteroidales bacterium]
MEEKLNLVVFMREYPSGMAGTKRVQNFLDYLGNQKGMIINVIAFRGQFKQQSLKGIYRSIPYRNIGSGVEMKLSHLHRIISYYFKGLRAVASLRRKGCPNVIYNSGGINIENFPFIFFARILGFKLILAIEEDYTFFRDNIKVISKFKCWTIEKFDFLNCRWADAVVAISNYLRIKYDRLRAKNVVLIPITAYLNHDSTKTAFNDPLQILYAGTFTDKDGVGEIIEGYLKFRTNHENSMLILTGESAQQRIYLEKYKNVEGIIFTGRVEDDQFYKLLRNADVLCMCRTNSGFAQAGFPFKLGEYLATGNPVISTRVSDVELYLTEDDAFLIDRADPELISDVLSQIVDDPVKARLKGLNGMSKCKEHFSPDMNGEKLLKTIKMIASN